jgi:DNA polymerase-3 subunit delta'
VSKSALRAEESGFPESDALAGYPHPRKQRVLFGHSAEAASLAEAARSGRLHHGLLISGPKGVGKATLAWRLARALLSHRSDSIPNDLSAPPQDKAALLIDALAHPDAMSIRRPWDEKAKRHKTEIPVDEVRKLVAFFGRHAAQGGWRIAIVDAAEEMSRAAENALLKTLEEPPPRALIVLIANAPGALLPTTRSRCRKLTLKQLPKPDMERALEHLGQASKDQSNAVLAALAEGAPGRALALGQGDALALYADAVRLLGSLGRPDIGVVTTVADRLARPAAADSYRLFLDLLGQLLRWMVMAKAGHPQALEALGKDGQFLRQACQRPSLDRLTALWDTWSASFLRADALNLDKRHAIAEAFLEAEAALR